MRQFLAALVAGLLMTLALVLPAGAQTELSPAENAWARTWIATHCCVTNNCCFRITEKEVEAAGTNPDTGVDRYRIRATGQVIDRTKWSPDGGWWRCACDRNWQANDDEKKYVVHQGAETRCLFVPRQTVLLWRPPGR